MTTKNPTPAPDLSHEERIESAENELEEGIVNAGLEKLGLLPLPDAAPSDGPAPAA